MKRDYEKLQRRHQRQMKNAPVEKSQTDQDETEVRKLSGKLEVSQIEKAMSKSD